MPFEDGYLCGIECTRRQPASDHIFSLVNQLAILCLPLPPAGINRISAGAGSIAADSSLEERKYEVAQRQHTEYRRVRSPHDLLIA
jgi:hypothetical protein